jgi:DNA-directed RNA polymerase subunit omega
MIEALKDDTIVNKVGGRFKLASLIQKRFSELIQGSRPMIKRTETMTDLEVIIEEIKQDKLGIDYEHSDILPADKLQ